MGQATSILHLLEGPCISVLRILQNLLMHEQFSSKDINQIIQSGAIVYNTEDRPKRFFPEWYSCVIQEQKIPGEELSAENSEDLVFDMATKLLDLGRTLQSQSNHEEIELTRYADKLPGKNLITGLAASPDYFSLEVRFNSL